MQEVISRIKVMVDFTRSKSNLGEDSSLLLELVLSKLDALIIDLQNKKIHTGDYILSQVNERLKEINDELKRIIR